MSQKAIKIHSVNQWLTYNQKREGARPVNVELLREYKEIKEGLKRLSVVLAFLVLKMKIPYVHYMWNSVVKQRHFVHLVIQDLKKYQVEPVYEAMFHRDVTLLHNRIEHIDRIVKEDIKLTEYQPFFEYAFDWSVFDEVHVPTSIEEVKENDDKGWYTSIDYLCDLANEWNEKHPEVVAKHMESIREELETIDAAKAIRKEKDNAEKQALKEKRKAENAEIRQRKKYEEKRRSRKRRIDRSFERYFK